MIKDVTDLDVYQRSLKVLPRLYDLLNKLPNSGRDTVNQTKRAGKSVPAQIAEGFAKRFYELEFKRYLLIALGSSDEVITHLRIIIIVVPELKNESLTIFEEYKIISKQLNKLYKKWHSS